MALVKLTLPLLCVVQYASALAYGGGAGVNWQIPDGQLTYVASTYIVPELLSREPSQNFVAGAVQTQVQRESSVFHNNQVAFSGGTGPVTARVNGNTVYPGDQVSEVYQKDMSNATYGQWAMHTEVTRGPAGIAAGASSFSVNSAWDGWYGGLLYDSMANIVSINSWEYQSSWVPRTVTFKNIVLRGTSTTTAWCSGNTFGSGSGARNFVLTGGPTGHTIAGGSECILQSVSFSDPPSLV